MSLNRNLKTKQARISHWQTISPNDKSVISFIVSVQLLVDISDVWHKIDGITSDDQGGLAGEGLLSCFVDLVRGD